MLTLWRRHRAKRPHKSDRYFRKCRCCVWAEGTVEGRYIRKSLKTRNWERGEELKRGIEAAKQEGKQITIDHALHAFIQDCESRNLNRSTLSKYRRLRSTLVAFADQNGWVSLSELEADKLRSFRRQRVLSPTFALRGLSSA